MPLGQCCMSVFAFGKKQQKAAARIHTAAVAVNVNRDFKHSVHEILCG